MDSDYIHNTAEALREVGYNVYENPNKTEIEKQFNLNDKTVIIRPLISKQPDNNKNVAPIEKILVDFLIENKKIKIMEDVEAKNVVKMCLPNLLPVSRMEDLKSFLSTRYVWVDLMTVIFLFCAFF